MTDREDTTRSMYLKAISELEEVLLDPNATQQQKREALDAMHELDRNFLAKPAKNLHERTDQMQRFTTLLSEFLASLDHQQQSLDAIERLRTIIEQSKAILRGESDRQKR